LVVCRPGQVRPAPKEELVEAAESARAWSGLIDLHPVVRAFLRPHCRDESELDDVSQEVLLRAARFRARRSGPVHLRAWLIRIAVNALREHRRRETRLPRQDDGEELLERMEGREEEPGETPEEHRLTLCGVLLERPRVLCSVGAAMSELDPSDQAVLDAY